MDYTLADFLRDRIVPEIRLLTHTCDFTGIPLRSVSVQELPVQRFSGKDTLVLSTALGCREDAQFIRLITDVRAAGAQVLFLTFENPNYRLSQSVIRHADVCGISLFRIPWNCRFADLQAAVTEKVRLKQTADYRHLQTTLFNDFFENRPLDDAALRISSLFRKPVLVLDRQRRICGRSGGHSANLSSIPASPGLPITLGSTLAGYLCIGDSPAEIPVDTETLRRCLCFPLSLWFQKQNSDEQLLIKQKQDLVWQLASGADTLQQELILRSRRLGYDLSRPCTCLALRAVSKMIDSNPSHADEIPRHASGMEALLQASAARQQLQCMTAARALDFVLYLETPENTPSVIDSYLAEAEASLRSAYSGYDFYFGISDSSRGAPDYRKLYQNASSALDYCISAHRTSCRWTYRDTQEASLLSLLRSREEIVAMARETVGMLQEFDTASRMDLVTTLREFIRSNYNTSETARNLHIHRQSLLYRLEKIEALTHLSLSEHRDLFLLEICCRVLFQE